MEHDLQISMEKQATTSEVVFVLVVVFQRFSDMSTYFQIVGISHTEHSTSEIGLMASIPIIDIFPIFLCNIIYILKNDIRGAFLFPPTISFASIPYHSIYQSKIKINQYAEFALTH